MTTDQDIGALVERLKAWPYNTRGEAALILEAARALEGLQAHLTAQIDVGIALAIYVAGWCALTAAVVSLVWWLFS